MLCLVKLLIVLYNGRIEARRNSFKLVKGNRRTHTAIKELSNRLDGYYTCTRVSLEKRIQISFQVKYRVLVIILVLMK